MSGALLLLATTSAYADAGMKLLCTRDNERQWVRVNLNFTTNTVWDNYTPGVAHDGPFRKFALHIVSGLPFSNAGATMSWGTTVLAGNVVLTETEGGTVQYKCTGLLGGDGIQPEVLGPHP